MEYKTILSVFYKTAEKLKLDVANVKIEKSYHYSDVKVPVYDISFDVSTPALNQLGYTDSYSVAGISEYDSGVLRSLHTSDLMYSGDINKLINKFWIKLSRLI